MLGIGIGTGRRRDLIVPESGSGPGPFPVNAVNFDATNDWIGRAAAITGAVDGDSILMSLWFNILGNDVFYRIATDSSSRIKINRAANNKLTFAVRTAAPANIWAWDSVELFTTLLNPGWHNLLLSAQLDVTPVGHVFLDDVALSITEPTVPTAGDIDWTAADFFVGSDDGASKYDGDMAEFYLTNEFLDISVEANRRKFIDADGFPVDLGVGGITPTGTVPLLLFSGATGTWHTNDGSGGGFTEFGALTDAATSPSD